MKKILAIGLSLFMSQQMIAQVPKTLIGKTFYNTDKWNLNPRFGGIPSIKFDAANKATVKKGDVVENATVKKFGNSFIVTSTYRKISDTFTVEKMMVKSIAANVSEMKDQDGQLWSTRFSPTSNQKELNSFPEAQKGFKKNVIALPQKDNEELLKVELYAGIYKDVDCNSYMMLGTIDEQTLQGFGYTYYKVSTEERIAGTLRACLDGVKTRKFIHALPTIVRYNSKLPLVIYAPENVQIRYRIYSTTQEWEFARPQ